MEDYKTVKEKYKKLIKEAKKELKTPGMAHKQIPNILTSLRLLAPFFIIPVSLTGNFLLTAIVASVFGLTDLVDGFIARKFHLQSELGGVLDALADKIFVGSLLIASSVANPYLIINILLEAAIAGINVKEELKGKKASSSRIGKIKTWVLFALSIAGIIAPGLSIGGIVPVLALGTSAMQLLTISSYVKKYKDDTHRIEPEEKEEVVVTDTPKEEDSLAKERQKEVSASKEIHHEEPHEVTIEELKEIRNRLTRDAENASCEYEDGPSLHKKNK